jgi:hypothetical protein
VELGSGHLPLRAVRAIPTKRATNPWSEFLERVLPPPLDAGDDEDGPASRLPRGMSSSLAGTSAEGRRRAALGGSAEV